VFFRRTARVNKRGHRSTGSDGGGP